MLERGDQEEEHGGQSSCQWADLHPPLLQLILRRLTLPDYFRFGSVCQPWHEAQSDLPYPYAELPMLFFSKVLAGRSDDSRLFLSPSDGRCYHIDTKLEGSSERHVNCIASSHGRLLVHDFFVSANVSKLFLLNPFAGARIELPDCRGFRHYFGRPIALSSSPTDPNCKIMVAYYLHVMYCRIGDAKRTWTKLRIFSQPEDFIHDIIFLPGNQRFYGLTNKYDLVFLDAMDMDPPILDYTMDMDPPIGRVGLDDSQLEPLRDRITQPHLVEYMGQILLVRLRDFNLARGRKANCVPEIHLDVFRADLDEKAWVRVDSLGGGALFIGEGCSGWIPASRAGTWGDRIYCSRSRLQLTTRQRSKEEEWCWLEHQVWDGKSCLHRPPVEIERRVNYSLFWIMP